jgi:hypothetical protein
MGRGSSKRKTDTKVKRPSVVDSQASRGENLEVHQKEALKQGAIPSLSANKIVICKFLGCHDIVTTQSFCRFHYLASWKKLKTKEAKKKGQELQAYLKLLSQKFPEEFLEKLKTEVEDMSEREGAEEEATEKPSLFDAMEGDDDLETIIQGLKVEDF